jgi:hypothetical protein
MLRRSLPALLAALLLFVAARVDADKIDDLSRALTGDSSYKVRVQAALVLGKLGDRRAVPALIRALSDANETVRGVAAISLGKLGDASAQEALSSVSNSDRSDYVRQQARKALAMLSGGGVGIRRAGNPNARFFIAVDFTNQKTGGSYGPIVRTAILQGLSRMPDVTLNVGGEKPSRSALQSKNLQGFVVDGTITRLSSAGGQIDCDLKAYVATYPDRSIKMMTQEGATLQGGSSSAEVESSKKECLSAAAGAIGDDVGKFLARQQSGM